MWLLTYCIMPVYGWGIWTSYGDQQCHHRSYKTAAICQVVVERVNHRKDELWAQGTIKSRWQSLGRYAYCRKQP